MNTINYDSDDDDDIFLEEEEPPINAIVYYEMENLFENICEEKYVLFSDQHTQFCNIISEAQNEEDILDNLTFSEDNIYEWHEEQNISLLFGTDLCSHKPNLNKYVKLIAVYDDYNKIIID